MSKFAARARAGVRKGLRQSTQLALHRLPVGSGVTAVSTGVEVLADDAFTTVAQCSLDVNGVEVACYVEALSGTQPGGKPLSVLLQFDATLTKGVVGTATLHFNRAPTLARLTKRTIGWQTGLNATNLDTAYPTNMHGLALRPAAERCKWFGWLHDAKLFSTIPSPTAGELGWRTKYLEVLPRMHNLAPDYGTGSLHANQYGRVHMELLESAQLDDAEAFRRALVRYGFTRDYYYTPNVYTDGDDYGTISHIGSNEQFHPMDTGYFAYLYFGDDFARDVLVVGSARARAFGLQPSGQTFVPRFYYGQTLSVTAAYYNLRLMATGLMVAGLTARLGYENVVFNGGKTVLEWIDQMHVNLLAHDGWETRAVGKRLIGDTTDIQNGQTTMEPWKVMLVVDTLMWIHRKVRPNPAIASRLHELMQYVQSLLVSGSGTVGLPYYDVVPENGPAFDLHGFFPSAFQWTGNEFGGTFAANATTLLDTVGLGALQYLDNQENPTCQKITQETFKFSGYYFGFKYGS